MCVTLTLPDGTEVSTIEELDAAIGKRAPIDGDYPDGDWPRDCCLCPIDLGALAKMMGWSIDDDLKWDPMHKIASMRAEERDDE